MSHILPYLSFQCKVESLTVFAGVKRDNVDSGFCSPIKWGMEVNLSGAHSQTSGHSLGALEEFWGKDKISKGNYSYSPFILFCFGTIIISEFSKTKKLLLRICLASKTERRFCLKGENHWQLLQASVGITSLTCNGLKTGIPVKLVI